MYMPKQERRTNEKATRKIGGVESELTCDVCKGRVGSSGAYIYVLIEEALEYEKADETWHEEHPERAHTLSDLVTHPHRAPWRIAHDACQPEPPGRTYDIDVAQFQTHKAVVAWTAQLMDKTWLPFTNWGGLLRRIGGPV